MGLQRGPLLPRNGISPSECWRPWTYGFLGEFEHWQPKYQRARPQRFFSPASSATAVTSDTVSSRRSQADRRGTPWTTRSTGTSRSRMCSHWPYVMLMILESMFRLVNQWFKTWPVDFTSLYDIFWKVSPEVSEIIDLNIHSPSVRQSDGAGSSFSRFLSHSMKIILSRPNWTTALPNAGASMHCATSVQYYVYLPVLRIMNIWFRPRIEQINLEQHW